MAQVSQNRKYDLVFIIQQSFEMHAQRPNPLNFIYIDVITLIKFNPRQ